MRTVVLASLRTHTRRYVAALLAVTIGVGFVVTTNAISSAARAGIVAGVELPYRNADAVLTDLDGDAAASLVTEAEAAGHSASVLGWTLQQVTSADGRVHDRVDVGVIATDPDLRWQTLEEGRHPRAAGEAVADVNAAKSSGVEVGDRLRVGSGSNTLDVVVVGLVDSPSASVGAKLYLTWADAVRWSPTFYVDSVAYAASGSDAGLLTELERATGATAHTPGAFVEQRSTDLSQGVNVLALVLLLFAAIAMFVSVLVIANTFSILFAQRTRDFALLRCVGATRRQVLRSVRVEALLLGLVASTIGLLAGAGVGYALVALARALTPAFLGDVSLSATWLAGAFAVGMVVTLVASWLPTRRVVAVSPLAALRPDDSADLRTRTGRWRLACGVALTGLGVALLAAAIVLPSPHVMVAGGGAVFLGVLLTGPVLVPAAIRVLGSLAAQVLGTPARLATGNAVRNPRRTAATTASLLVGVTLTTAVLTGLASSRTAVDSEMAVQHPLDLAVTAAGDSLPGDLLADVRATDGVEAAVAVQGAPASVSDDVGDLPLLAAPPELTGIAHADVIDPAADEVWLPYERAPDADQVTVTVGGSSLRLRVRAGEGWGDAALVTPATLARLTDDTGAHAVWVRAESGADAEDLAGDVTALATPVDAEVTSGLGQRAYVTLQLDVLTAAVVALLAIAVVIALIGIGNTLGLSVLERGRENALLRALGLTRRQLRATLATEALLLALVATLLGTTLGVAFAWVGVLVVIAPVIDSVSVVLPWGQLLLVIVVAGVAGLLSCLLPARRAARVAPAAGLATD